MQESKRNLNQQIQSIQQIQFLQWNTADRCNLDSIIDEPEAFTMKFIHQLELLIPDHFINMQHSARAEIALLIPTNSRVLIRAIKGKPF